MELQTLSRPALTGTISASVEGIFLMCHQLCKRKNHWRSGSEKRWSNWNRNCHRHLRAGKKYVGASIFCSSGDTSVSSPDMRISDARVLYCVAPAMGHNQESHPESNFRVPAIKSALEKMELTEKFRGSEVIELQNFKPASVDDIASVHARSYVSALEKAMSKASQEGLILLKVLDQHMLQQLPFRNHSLQLEQEFP